MDSILKGTTPVGPADTVRIVTNDFMYTGGDGYTAFASGTDVQFKGDLLLDVAIDYIRAHSPVAPVVEGRMVSPVIALRGGRLNVRPPRLRLGLVIQGPSFRATRHRVRSGT